MDHIHGCLDMLQEDFMDETEFQHLISIIQREAADDPIVDFSQDYECDLISGCTDHKYQALLQPCEGFACQEAVAATNAEIGAYGMCGQSSAMIWNSLVEEGAEDGVKGSGDFEEENSSETATTNNSYTQRKTSTGKGAKGDRARTLVSERKRRSRMKEKLFALRSLVPNITKMDKASIVEDAAMYIQELQMQAKNLKAEIATIESSVDRSSTNQKGSSQTSKKSRPLDSYPLHKTIVKMDLFQVEERGYYVRLVCNKGRGVAVSLQKALESITSFDVQSSNLSTVGDTFVFTFTLTVRRELDMNLPNLNLWVAGAFFNQGFEFNTPDASNHSLYPIQLVPELQLS